MSFLKLPSRKILIDFLCSASTLNNSIFGDDLEDIPIPDDYIDMNSSVWIQGSVIKIDSDKNCVYLNDNTGTVMLMSCDKVAAKIAFKKGMYLMCVGAVVRRGASPIIKPVKLQDMSHDMHAEVMWGLEVRDQLHFLTRAASGS